MDSSNLQLSIDNSNINEIMESLTNKSARQAVLKELEKRLLLQRYFNELQINIDNDETSRNDLLQKFCNQVKISTPQEFDTFLERTGQSKDFFTEKLIYEEQLNQLKKVVITSHSVNDLFLERKMRQDSVLFTLIRIEKESVAREIYYRIKHDFVDFGLLAKQFSIGAEAKHGGIVGPIQLQTLNPELRSRLVAMQEDEVSEPFTVDGKQYLILKLIRVDKVTLNSQIENVLREELFEQWINRQLSLNHSNIQASKSLS